MTLVNTTHSGITKNAKKRYAAFTDIIQLSRSENVEA